MEYWVTVQGQKLAAHAGQRLHSVLTQAGFLADAPCSSFFGILFA